MAFATAPNLTAKRFGGRVEKSDKREYGRAQLQLKKEDVLFQNVSARSQAWMSHSDTIKELPDGFELLANTESIPLQLLRSRKMKVSPHFLSTAYSFIPKCTTRQKGKR